eukprot:CAMPEP_0180569650 /NCGR_PEP_ID=MMETSP1037_2-20121125/7790_1 /TAXON_ID=632150 /ORGANISM="Azadinium spinosum, Strain 3D9" /LENGTH=50 /DNA_ID=CAMNT_0022586897 /DNA_START=215 /DNA_END=363 /DNA_ORIENTATION=+
MNPSQPSDATLPLHIWPAKNGDFNRSGASSNVGPIMLEKVAWSFEDPDPG